MKLFMKKLIKPTIKIPIDEVSHLLIGHSIFFINACKTQKMGNEDTTADSTANDELTMVMSDLYGGANTELIEVIRSQKALDNFFLQVNKTRKPGIKPPAINFKENIAIIYCSGQTTQSGLPKLSMEQAEDDRIILNKNMQETTENQEQKAVLMPFGLYIMPLTDKEILLQPDS